MKTDTLQISDIYRQLERMREEMARVGRIVSDPTVTPPTVRPQAINQIRNGSFSHSVGSWAHVSTADDRRYECAHWFSHPDTANYPMHSWTTATTGAKTFVDANFNTGTGNTAVTGHGYETADVIRLTTTGTLPSALSLATDYFIIKVDADNLKFASSLTNAYAGTAITGGTAAGGGTHTITPKNFTLKSDDHASYSSSQSNWTRQDTPAGCARINEDYTLDAPLAQPTAEPSYTLYCVFNIAKANQYVYAPITARLTCGIYGRQDGTWNYLQGNFTITGSTTGTISTATSRDYVVHTRTDRGFTIQSTALTVASAPADTDFSNGARVNLSWQRPLNYGVIGYDIYRKTNKTFLDANVTPGTDTIAITSHTYATTDPVTLTTTGVLPAGLALATTYYVIKVDANNIKLASSAANATAGTAVDIWAAAGGGTHTVNAFKLLDRVETGLTSYIDNNSYINETVTAYPSADFTKLTAFTATRNSVLANIATDGVDDSWDTLPFAVRVPNTYDHSLTDFARSQWVRWNLTGLTNGRLDLRVTDVVLPTALRVTSDAGQFVVGHVGMNCTITDEGSETHTAAIDTYVSANEVTFALGDGVPFTLKGYGEATIAGGGSLNSLYIDLAHVSFGEDAIFGFHTDDLSSDRGTPPVAANGSNQGGTTEPPPPIPFPGGGDGRTRCVWEEEVVTITDGAGSILQVRAKDVRPGDYIIYQKEMTQVREMKWHRDELWRIETENGFIAITNLDHKYITFPDDEEGTELRDLNEGDDIVTSIDGKDVVTQIKTKEWVGEGVVVGFYLAPRHRFLIGTGMWRKWGGICSHNKNVILDDPPTV